LAAGPAGGAYNAPRGPLSWIKGVGRREGGGEMEKGEEERREGREKKGRRREWEGFPLGYKILGAALN